MVGIVIGYVSPAFGAALKPLGDGFIKLVKMLIAPIIFCTVVHGIASMDDLKKVGRLGLKALVYFEVVTTFALIFGFVATHLWQPGIGMNIDPATLDPKSVQIYAEKAAHTDTTSFLLGVIPDTLIGAFVSGEILQVVLISLIIAFALHGMGPNARPILEGIDRIATLLFGAVGLVMRFAPIGAFGAIAFTVGRYGLGTLATLGQVVLGYYVMCLTFVFIVLGGIAAWAGFNIWSFIRYIGDEILIVLGTSSSESVLPRMVGKMERLGCSESAVGLI